MTLGNNLSKTQILDSSEKGLSADNKADSVEGTNVLSEILETQKASLSDLKEIDEITTPYITFKVAQENYALPVNLIDEVVPQTDISILPQVPKYILGMANVRGEVYSVLDLGLKHNLRKAAENFSPNFLITIKSDHYKIALATEQLPLTIIVKESELSGTDSLGQNINDQNHIAAIVKKENNMLMCIDITNLVNDLKL